MEFKHKDLTECIIKGFYAVYNRLGYGFLEKVYNNAMAVELRDQGLTVVQEACILVHYNEAIVGEYYADLLVNDAVVVELKAVKKLTEVHEAQLVNYLKSTVYEVGLLFNFGPKPELKRKIYDNKFKGDLTWVKRQLEREV